MAYLNTASLYLLHCPKVKNWSNVWSSIVWGLILSIAFCKPVINGIIVDAVTYFSPPNSVLTYSIDLSRGIISLGLLGQLVSDAIVAHKGIFTANSLSSIIKEWF